MKQILMSIVTALLVAMVTAACAQDAAPKAITPVFMVGITGGLSSPSGNFAKTDYDNNKSGFAGPGYNIGITGTWLIKKHFGISALISYDQFAFKGVQHIANGFHESFDVDSASATSKGNNHSINILIGPYYSLPLGKRWSVDARFLAGLTNATLAGWDVVLTDAGITHPPLTQNSATAGAFGWQGGIGVRYSLSAAWALMLNGDYFYSKPDFSITNIDRNANAGRELSNYAQPIAGIKLDIGITYVLGY